MKKLASHFSLIPGFRALKSLFAVALLSLAAATSWASSPNVVISQAYGGGGNAGSVYKNDFIELFNRSGTAVDLTGWSVQYTSSAGTTWTLITPLSGTIAPYSYYLVQEASGTGGTTALPAPDATGTIAMGATGFKVAVCNTTTGLTGSSPTGSQLVDFLGAAANAFEGTVGPAPSNTQSVSRTGGGCTDSDNNAADFTAGTVTPRNSASTANTNCSGVVASGFVRVETAANGSGTVVTAQNLVAGNSITVYAIARDASTNYLSNAVATTWSLLGKTGKVVDGDLVPSGDSKSAVFTGHGTGNGTIHATLTGSTSIDSGAITVTAGNATAVRVETAADGSGSVAAAQNIAIGRTLTLYAIRRDAYSNYVDNAAATWSLTSKSGSVADSDLVPSGDTKSAVFTANATGSAIVHAVVSGVTSVDSGTLTVVLPTPAAVVISQIYGGGGNAGNVYAYDFVELFNRSGSPVDLSGWSIQYGSSTGAIGGTSTTQINLTNTVANPSLIIAAHSYYLVQLGSNGVPGNNPFPTADYVNTNVNLSATVGKVALANIQTGLGTVTVLPDTRIIDLIGYGGASISEGANAPAPGNGTGELRANEGCTDTDNNSLDFTAVAPVARNSTTSPHTCPDNTPPIISAIANQSVAINSATPPITFTVSDAESAPNTLLLSVASSNPTLVPTNNIVLTGSGVSHTVTVTPASGQTGSAIITITVSDTNSPSLSGNSSFTVFVGDGPQLGLLFSDNFNNPIYTNNAPVSLLGDTHSDQVRWHNHSGDSYYLVVSNNLALISIPVTNTEDVNAIITNNPVSVDSGSTLYFGFTISQTALPTVVTGDYFMHLKDLTTSNFYAKVYASTSNAVAGKYRIGVANRASGAPNVQFPKDLDLNTTYSVVVRYKVSVAQATLWINPVAVTDPSVTATDVGTPGEIDAIAMRETATGSAGSQMVDNIVVSTLFADAVQPSLTIGRSGNNAVISWPTNNFTFLLQTNAAVVGTWGTNSTLPGVVGARYVVTTPLTSTNVFYRLLQQQ